MKLSKYFNLEELANSPTAERNKINNTPTTEHIENLQVLLNKVVDYVREFLKRPLRLSSGYRSPLLNKKVGGVENSVHTRGCACDMIVSPEDQRAVMIFLNNSRLPFDQAIAYPNRGFIHIGIDPIGDNRRELLLSPQKGKYEKYIF